jgi:molybdenum cofactor cytidylyltransferase
MPTQNNNGKIGIILLAAGESKRLGRPKQLLKFAGKTFLQHGLKTAHASIASPIVTVLGANADVLKNKIADDTHVVINANWNEGMASSIRAGVKAILEIDPSVDGVILMVCDQPYVDCIVLNNLIAAHQISGKPIVASSYNNTFGPPTLFQKVMFPELLQLYGDTGAKSVVKQHADEVEIISFPMGEIDIDTEADYEKLSKQMSEQ